MSFPAQIKRSLIITNKHAIYKLFHKLTNDLRLRILGHQEKLRKSQKSGKICPYW